MSTHDPSGRDAEGDDRPPADNRPPQPGAPSGEPPGPDGAPPPPQYPGGSPYDRPPPAYGGPYGAPPPVYGPPEQAPGGGPVSGMPPLGGWGARIVARLIDLLLVAAVISVIVLPVTGVHSGSNAMGLALSLGGAALYLVYEGLMLNRDGQTLGKKAMRIRVAMLVNGARPDPAAAWARAAVYILPAAFFCGVLWWLIDGLFGVFDRPYRQCIHDKAARTVVVTTT